MTSCEHEGTCLDANTRERSVMLTAGKTADASISGVLTYADIGEAGPTANSRGA